MFSHFFTLSISMIILLITVHGVLAGGRKRPSSSAVLWKSLFSYHSRWSGYYIHDQSRFMCYMYVHSVQAGEDGGALVSFTGDGIKMEMNGFSDGNFVIFVEENTWNKSKHFEGHTDLAFNGTFTDDIDMYYVYKANVSSLESHKFGTVTLFPESRSNQGNNRRNEKKSGGAKLALIIGIPFFVGSIVLTLGIYIIIWGVRKGYLRHVPWTYRTFRNSVRGKSGLEMDSNQPETVKVEGIDTSDGHI